MLTNFRKNCMGTICFDAKFDGMRKPQDFDVYPLKAGDDPTRLRIQSDTRFGYIYLGDGRVFMSPSKPGGANSSHLAEGKYLTPLAHEDLEALKAHVLLSASSKAGSNGIISCDNSGALDIEQKYWLRSAECIAGKTLSTAPAH